MRIIDQKGFAAGGMYLVIGLLAAGGSLQYPIGTVQRMGPGFFPFAVGAALVVVGLVVAAGAMTSGAQADKLGQWQWRNLLLVLLSVVLFGVLLRPAGAFLATAVMVGVASFASRETTLRATLATIVVLTLVAWGVFIGVLGMQITLLPRGLGL